MTRPLSALVMLLALAPLAAAAPPGRVPFTTGKVAGSPEPPPALKMVNAFPKVAVKAPLLMTHLPGTDRLFVAEQGGRLVSFRNRPDAVAELCFDPANELRSLGRGPTARTHGGFETIYGLAFHPKFAANRRCVLCYTLRGKDGAANLDDGTRVSTFTLTDAEPPRVDPASETILLTFKQGGHNGGDLHFGPDGFLYISTGDAATPNPPDGFRTGQDITDLLGSILRIDIDHPGDGTPYRIPADNPFVGQSQGGKPARGEVWSYGYRNPWRMSFDRATGRLWVGDVGWELWEMVHVAESGSNHGWSLVEARQAVNAAWPAGPTPVRAPVIEVPHTDGASVTGGYVYRGRKFPELAGQYVFGDWSTRRVWAAKLDGATSLGHRDLVKPTARVVAFGEDAEGELYALDHDTGVIYGFERNAAAGIDPKSFPRTLSATGLFADTATHTPAPGAAPFAPAASQWQDRATAERFVALPGTASVVDHGDKKPLPGGVSWLGARLHFPAGAVLAKTLSLELDRGDPASRRRLETQLLHFDGEDWNAYTYAWRDDQRDADLVPAEGAERVLMVKDPAAADGRREQVWSFNSRAQCAQCHNPWAETALGFQPAQLARGGQVRRFHESGLIRSAGRRADPAKEPALADPHDAAVPLADRARAYLHGNCGHCHRGGGGGSVEFELHAGANLNDPKLRDAPPLRGHFGIADARVLAPGDPARSTLVYRVAKFGVGRMPHLGSELPDPDGVALLTEWVRSLDPQHELSKPSREFLGYLGDAVTLARDAPGLSTDRIRALLLKVGVRRPLERDLVSSYFPLAGRGRKVGVTPRPASILALTGDAAAGRERLKLAASQCLNCHQYAGAGKAVGPDLAALAGKRTREHLLESILEPSRRVDPAYQTYILRAADGRVLAGVLVKKTAEAVVIRDAQNVDVTVPAGEVDGLQPGRESLMPAGLVAEWTPQQLADLLAALREGGGP